jgi:predicted Zn-dependent peptidase
MQKKILPNGITVIFEKKPIETVTIEILVKAGSNYESKKLSGISHFIEHVLFETKTRDAGNVSAEIDKIGGEINAFTWKENTSFFIKVPKKHFNLALEVLSDIIKNPIFKEESIERERKIILDEIKLWKDEPMYYQWVLFEKTLFNESPIGNPAYGNDESVSKINKHDLINFYKRYYVPNNMIISIVGNIDGVFNKIDKKFSDFYGELKEEEKQFKEGSYISELIEKREMLHSCIVVGYKAVKRNDKDSYVFDIISTVLGYGMSSWLFNEIRTKRGLGYGVGINYEAGKEYGYIAAHATSDKKNVEEVKKIILEQFKKLKSIDEKKLKEAKESVEGQFILGNEDSIKLAHLLCSWEMIGDVGSVKNYLKNINKVTKQDIIRIVDKYFKNNSCTVVIEQK